MKKILFLILLFILPLFSCETYTSNEIMIVSDTHFLADSLTAKEGDYLPENITSDGRVQECDDKLLDALIEKVNKQKPQALLITGDLTFNGEKASHQELAFLLNKISQETKVLVIPGNHDILSKTTYKYNDDATLTKVENITQDDFREIYVNQGYTGAYSYDEESLSYIYKLKSNQYIVMLDTAMYYQNDYNGFNTIGGYVLESTLSWLDTNINKLKQQGADIVVAGHHNLLLHNSMFSYSYQLYNYQSLLDLLVKYDISLYLSGHLHIQSIKNINVNGKVVYDIASNSLLTYGNTYGILKFLEGKYEYKNYIMEFDDGLLNRYSYLVFFNKYQSKIMSSIYSCFDSSLANKLLYILPKINAYYFAGRLDEIKNEIDKYQEAIEVFLASDHSNVSYIKSILEEYDYAKNNIFLNF